MPLQKTGLPRSPFGSLEYKKLPSIELALYLLTQASTESLLFNRSFLLLISPEIH